MSRKDDFEPCAIPSTQGDVPLPVQPMPSTLADALHDTLAALQTARPSAVPDFISADPETQLLAVQAEQLAASLPMHIPVLITGASGTGKELIARKFRPFGAPFLAVNMAALPEQLITSILFGHKRGAFTGAINDEPGAFRSAKSGTLFLDEIGDMPLALQPVLLRVLQERRVTGVGDNVEHPVTCRVIAATNVDLAEAVREKKFRADLLARLDMISLRIKPLTERLDDVYEIGKAFGLTGEDCLHIITNPTMTAMLKERNVRALQAFAARKQYMHNILA